MGILNYFGFDKVTSLANIIKHYGPKNAFLMYFRNDQLKMGQLVGEDKNGNKYYQSDYYFFGSNRWVIYSDKFGYDYDASQITPEWYGWLHYKTDLIPSEDKSRPKYKWMAEPSENYSGTSKEYVPYSTTKRKIEAWLPPKCNK